MKHTDDTILKAWIKAWNDSNGTNPLSREIDRAMMQQGISILDVYNRLGVIAGIEKKNRTEAEDRLFDFWMRTRIVAENALVDKCVESTQGSMFILKARYGYKDGMEISLSKEDKESKVKRTWGTDEVTSAIEKAAEPEEA